jgi:site-specific recombinase XerD
MGEISAADLRGYLAFRRQGEDALTLAPRSLSQALSSIRAFHRYLDQRHGVAQRRRRTGARPAPEGRPAPSQSPRTRPAT